MVDCITLTVPAKESALMVVRLTAAGVGGAHGDGLGDADDVKTAVYEACYAMTMQKFIPEPAHHLLCTRRPFAVKICAEGAWRETAGRSRTSSCAMRF